MYPVCTAAQLTSAWTRQSAATVSRQQIIHLAALCRSCAAVSQLGNSPRAWAMALSPRFVVGLTAGIFGIACAPPPSPPLPQPVVLSTPVSDVWDIVIQYFAENHAPIRTIDRASGLIVTDLMPVADSNANTWARCPSGIVVHGQATSGSFSVLVHGDSTRTTVGVTATWSDAQFATSCTTKGAWEAMFFEAVQSRAATRAPAPRSTP
jgi:hypothetical protein